MPIEYAQRDLTQEAALGLQKLPEAIAQKLAWGIKGHGQCEEIKHKRERVAEDNARIQFRLVEFNNQIQRVLRQLPEDFKTKTFDTFQADSDNERAFKLATHWNVTKDFGLCIMGPPGSGKTHLMSSILNKIIQDRDVVAEGPSSFWNPERQKIVVWENVTELIRKIRHQDIEEKRGDMLDEVRGCRFLFLDDLATGKVSEYTADILYLILEHRKNFKLPTFMTTNAVGNELKELFHERITSRIKESSVPVTLKGSDFRNKILQERLRGLGETS